MSKFLEIRNWATSPFCLHNEALSYILSEFRPGIRSIVFPVYYYLGKENELIQSVIDESNGKLRMYGSAEEFFENISIYKSFPANHIYFGSTSESFQTRPAIYQSLNDEKYIAKSDLFMILQNMVIDLTAGGCPMTFTQVVAIYLKCKQASIEKCVEFVKFDEKRFEEMQNWIVEEFPKRRLSMSEYELRRKEFSELSKEGIIEKFRALIPFTLDASQKDFLDAALMQSMKAPRSDWSSDILLCYSVSNAMISLMDKITDENPDLFLPRGEDSNEPITVRVFEDEDQQFLMKSEVFNTKSDSEESFTLSAITMEKLLTNHESEIHNIETPYFLKLNLTLAADIDRIMSFPSKDVRDIQEDGFSIEDLKNELANLGLKWRFPEIQNYAEAVYSEVDKRKKGSVLRTCDMFDAVEHCQINCILKIDDSLKKFVHSQKGCHRVYGLKCEDCAVEKSKKQEEKLSILEKELNELKMSHQKTLEEVQELQQKNLRLSVKNETNEIKMKQLTDNLAQAKLSIDEGNYSNADTSQQKIQCLICEKSIESGEDQIIRCPLCKRRFHSKCAINWLKEHTEGPACNGDLSKF